MNCIFIVLILLLCYYACSNNAYNVSRNSSPEYYTYHASQDGPKVGIIAGIHGNEPAGAVELTYLINSRNSVLMPAHGSIVIIPRANMYGLSRNVRHNEHGVDMNRIFENGSSYIEQLFADCDLVLDFHEGWGYHLVDSRSLGSTIMGNSHFADDICEKIVDALNIHISSPEKKYTIIPHTHACDINKTLACSLARRKKHHILIETTGQNDIQPINVRRAQVRTVIETVLSELHMY